MGGSCNPHIDLPRIARHIAALADSRGVSLVPPTEDKIDVLVVLNGCRRACGDREEVTSRARRCVIVAGESLNGDPLSENLLPQAVERALPGGS